MTFLNPAALFGLAAVGVPVAIHWLSKIRVRRVRWAATKFLQTSLQRHSRRLQMEDLLLLLLRCLFVALLVLFFARPQFGDGPAPGADTAAVVIVLDQSSSMGQSDGTQTRFERAKAAARDILGGLKPGSAAALYLVSNQVVKTIAAPTEDLDLVRRTLDQAKLTDRGSDLLPGVQAALETLKGLQNPRREIFILTDSQLSAWRQLSAIRSRLDAEKEKIAAHVVATGENGEDNVAVQSLRIEGGIPAVNQPVRCAVEIANFGRVPAERIRVRLSADDEPALDETMIARLEPGARRVVNLFARFREAGFHTITASIPGDRLPADNSRTLAVQVLEQITALVIEGAPSARPSDGDGFFVLNALAPVRPDQLPRYFLKPVLGRPADTEALSLARNDLVFLCNVRSLPERGAAVLADFVKAGGTLVVFPGPAADLAFYNDDPRLAPLLPGRLAPAEDAPSDRKYLLWQSRNYEHPVTRLWNDPQAGNLGSVRTTRFFPLQPKPGSRVVVKYADGRPALLEQSVGKGSVFLFGSTANTAWTTLPVHPLFVPLLARIVDHVSRGRDPGLVLSPGQPFVRAFEPEYAGKEFSVQPPGAKAERRIAGRIEPGDGGSLLRFGETEIAGPYRVFVGDEAKPKIVFSVQADPEESNLQTAPAAEIASLPGSSPKPGRASFAILEKAMSFENLAGLLALLLLLLAVLETGISHRMSLAK